MQQRKNDESARFARTTHTRPFTCSLPIRTWCGFDYLGLLQVLPSADAAAPAVVEALPVVDTQTVTPTLAPENTPIIETAAPPTDPTSGETTGATQSVFLPIINLNATALAGAALGSNAGQSVLLLLLLLVGLVVAGSIVLRSRKTPKR